MTTSKRAKKPRVKRVMLPSVMAPDATMTISVEKPGDRASTDTGRAVDVSEYHTATVTLPDYNPADHPVRRR